MAAAAAIVSAKKRKRPHSFETNPSIRKRQQNRLLRKLRVRKRGYRVLLLVIVCVHMCMRACVSALIENVLTSHKI